MTMHDRDEPPHAPGAVAADDRPRAPDGAVDAGAPAFDPRHGRLDIERRFAIDDLARVPLHEAARVRVLHDRDLDGTRLRLRLRRVTEAGRPDVLELGRTQPTAYPRVELGVTMRLSPAEHARFDAWPPRAVVERRHTWPDAASVDVQEGGGDRPLVAVFEVEFDSLQAAEAFVPPPWVGREITGDASRSGHACARPEAPSQEERSK